MSNQQSMLTAIQTPLHTQALTPKYLPPHPQTHTRLPTTTSTTPHQNQPPAHQQTFTRTPITKLSHPHQSPNHTSQLTPTLIKHSFMIFPPSFSYFISLLWIVPLYTLVQSHIGELTFTRQHLNLLFEGLIIFHC